MALPDTEVIPLDTIDILAAANKADVVIVGQNVAANRSYNVGISDLTSGWYYVRPDVAGNNQPLSKGTGLVWYGVEVSPIPLLMDSLHLQSGYDDHLVLISHGQISDMLPADAVHDQILAYHDSVTR